MRVQSGKNALAGQWHALSQIHIHKIMALAFQRNNNVRLPGRCRFWKVNREHAAPTREIAHSKRASVRFDATPADTEAQTQARSIAVSLLEQSKQIFCIPGWEASAFVLYLD
jgi:hypothetical protein